MAALAPPTKMSSSHSHLFTPCSSVPSGRIGPTKDDVFRSNDEFRAAVSDREAQDVAEVEAKMGRR